MKKCPFCAEEIQDEAIKCRYCNEFLDGREPEAQSQSQKGPKGPWYFSTYFLVIGFCCVGPFVLPLIWFNPRYGSVFKVVLTLIILLVSWAISQALMTSLGHLRVYYDIIQGAY